jgi:lysophospholipase L1-like esterase
MRKWTTLAAVVPTVTLSSCGAAGGDAAFGREAHVARGRYVALGDSFTAGPLIPDQHGSPAACLRSDRNYPSLVAHALRPEGFSDVSCTAATTAHMRQPQRFLFGRNRPQLDALTRDTTLVTLGIGGNDIGYSKIVFTCGRLSLTMPRGAPCAGHFGDSLDRKIDETAPKIGDVLKDIHERAPRARVLVVGYPRVLPGHTGCWPVVPAADGDVPYLDRFERDLNRMLADEASANGAEFVDTYRGGAGHDICAKDKWVEGILLTHVAAPVHPNARGMRVVADRVLDTIRGARADQ